MSSARFCIVRHGETDWNAQHRLQGHIDIALNAVGRQQAEAAAQGLAGLHFDAFYTSDLTRTRETAAAIGAAIGLRPHLEEGLRERHYGLFQGRTVDEVARDFPTAYAAYKARDLDHTFDDGESLRSFDRRIQSTLSRLAQVHAGETLLLVAHGGVLDVIYRRAMGRELGGPRDFPIPNAALNWVSIDGGRWQVEQWADQRHLESSLDEVAQ
ncbi:MAG TPA: histidine phosphatase family protein [Rhodocyclaceae bacterium]|nr:histidine phosphatase family protein [Rhodocyclaceae bacterium]